MRDFNERPPEIRGGGGAKKKGNRKGGEKMTPHLPSLPGRLKPGRTD